MRRICGIQMTSTELLAVVRSVKSRSSCNFLVFGLGNDSLFWQVMNRRGTTAFIEDDVAWMEKVRLRDRLPFTTSTRYNTHLRDWRRFLESEADFDLPLDASISNMSWDVILVDGPAAWCDDAPGRMKSIAASKRLAGPGGDVFVHDFDRQPEHDLALHFLGKQNHKSTSDKLAHFVI
jgi:glucuronoxylan 4-O-methyltransferase